MHLKFESFFSLPVTCQVANWLVFFGFNEGCLDNGATVDNILKSELAGQEAGMMKCLFIVETRALTCKALYTQSFDQLTDFLVDNEIQIGSVDDETRQARLKFHFVLFSDNHVF